VHAYFNYVILLLLVTVIYTSIRFYSSILTFFLKKTFFFVSHLSGSSVPAVPRHLHKLCILIVCGMRECQKCEVRTEDKSKQGMPSLRIKNLNLCQINLFNLINKRSVFACGFDTFFLVVVVVC
jgi:hypothetical protein